ncbi:hypothetical protein GX563_03635 [Candidatus Bathyarchaeota archaeon]|mgnify:CR=1 FL=1|nr:hypothetical protein [Candidatus Bathyarchaeota archaeon]
MRLTKILIGEFIVLIASVFIFRSLWTMLDQYFGYNYLPEFLILGIVLTVIGLIVLNHGVKCEIEKAAKPKSASP